MTRDYDAELGMIKAVWDFVQDKAEWLVATAPIIITYQGVLGGYIGSIDGTAGEASITSKGSTIAKEQAREIAVGIATIVAKILFNYASDNVRPNPDFPAYTENPINVNMVKLKEDMKEIKESFLNSKKDEELLSYLYSISNKADEISRLPAPPGYPSILVAYGFKLDVSVPGNVLYEPGTLTQLYNATDTYYRLTTAPRTDIVKRKSKNARLKWLFERCRTVLKQLDNSFELLKDRDPESYNGYKNVRKIVGPMTMHTKISGVVSKITNVELLTTEVVQDAKITILTQPYTRVRKRKKTLVTKEPLIVFTDTEGKYAAPTPDFKTTYTVICRLPGYAEQQTTNVFVKLGKATNKNFVLEPVQNQTE